MPHRREGPVQELSLALDGARAAGRFRPTLARLWNLNWIQNDRLFIRVGGTHGDAAFRLHLVCTPSRNPPVPPGTKRHEPGRPESRQPPGVTRKTRRRSVPLALGPPSSWSFLPGDVSQHGGVGVA